MERGQLEYSMEGSRVPFTLARVTGLWEGGGVLLRLPQREWRWEPNNPHSLSLFSPAKLFETLPRDEARCGRLSFPLTPDKALPIGTGTGTKGDAILLSCVLLPCHSSSQQGSSH